MQRMGRKNRPFYRISAIDQRVRRDGRVIETLGYYNPLHPDAGKQIELNGDRVKYWMSVGAQPSDTVRDMIARREWIDVKSWENDRAEDRKALESRLAKAAAAAASTGKKEG